MDGQNRKDGAGWWEVKADRKNEKNRSIKKKEEDFPILSFLHYESPFLAAKWELKKKLFFLNKLHIRVFRGSKEILLLITKGLRMTAALLLLV